LAQEHRQFEQAKDYYHKALRIKEDSGNFYKAASDYYQLGTLEQEQQQFEQAKDYYRRAFEIFRRYQDWWQASDCLTKWANVLETQENWTEALQIYTYILPVYPKHIKEWIGLRIKDFGRILNAVGESQFEAIWQEVTGEECPEQLRSAIQAASK
jgi:tetratricopeptide (TPR) repeat protein